MLPTWMQECTPKEVSDTIRRAVPGTIRSVPIEAAPGAQYMHCYETVDAIVKAHGGRRIEGWQILESPGHHLKIVHHAIWERPDGEWIDPSPCPDETITMFAPLAPNDPVFDGFTIAPRIIVLSSDPVVKQHIQFIRKLDADLRKKQHADERERLKRKRKAINSGRSNNILKKLKRR